MLHHGYWEYKNLGPSHAIRLVAKWHAMTVGRFLLRLISLIFGCASLQIPRLWGPHFSFLGFLLFPISFWEHPGGPREHPGTTDYLFAGSCGLSGLFCLQLTFQEIQNHEISTFEGSPWQASIICFYQKMRTMPSHVPTICFYQKPPINSPSGRYVNWL